MYIPISPYRPCIVKGNKGLFHKWVEHSEIIPPSIRVGGHNGGQLRYTTALVEFEDGRVREVSPEDIKFDDNKIRDYLFSTDKEAKDNG